MLLFIFLIGAVVGSFLNVCIYRLPRNESVVFPASRCPNCQAKLGVLDLVPILSYCFLLGRCRYCHGRIPSRYLVVEMATALLFVALAIKFPLPAAFLGFVFYAVFVAVLLVIFFTDIELQLIPDVVSFLGLGAGLAFNLLLAILGYGLELLISSLLGMFLGYSLFYLIARLGKLILKKDALGEGDLLLAALLGAWLGWQGLLLAAFLSYLIAAIFILPLLLAGKVKMGQAVAFGPAMVVAGLITLFFEQYIISWYLSQIFF